MSNINIALVPLDNRPVSYSLPKQTAEINSSVKVLLPPRNLMGNLLRPTNIDEVFNWLEATIDKTEINSIVICLDTIAYGGLVQSRRIEDDKEQILQRIEKLKNIIIKSSQKPEIFGFSSIMRISNNNINEEEKEYWNKYGEMLYGFSYYSHKMEEVFDTLDKKKLDNLLSLLPPEILEDYLKTRKRNFEINKAYIELLKDDFFDYLVFSQDDTGMYGLNVREGKDLQAIIKAEHLSGKACVKTGADEIPTNLVMRSIVKDKIRVFPLYSTENGKNIVSKYEDKPIKDSARGQIEMCGGVVVGEEEEADIILVLHTPERGQNDHALNLHREKENLNAIEFSIEKVKTSIKPLLLADVACANGGDNKLVLALLEQGIDLGTLFGYAGWNTTGNTLGSLISMGFSRYIAQKNNSYNEVGFKKLLLIRLADDWAYQTVVRQIIRAFTDKADLNILKEELGGYIQNISLKIGLDLGKYELSFPWNRTFEVEIDL